MNKRIILASTLSFGLALGVFAQTGSRNDLLENRREIREDSKTDRTDTRNTAAEKRKDVKEERKDAIKARDEKKGEIRALRSDFKNKTREERNAALEDINKKRQDFRKDLSERRDAFRDTIRDKREDLRGKMETHRAELKEKLGKIRDEQKQKTVERIDEQLARLNERMTDHFLHVLERIEHILTKVRSRADKAGANDHDVAGVNAALTKADTAIAVARSAIEAQSDKLYTIVVEGENALRQNVGKTRQQLRDDLKKLHELVRSARQAAVDALQSLRTVPQVDEELIVGDETDTGTVINP